MNLFSYTLPKKISRDKDNKKWFLRYSITYKGEKTEYPKEYGKTYLRGKNLNSIESLTEREREFNKVMLLLEMDLKDGIDPRNPATVKAAASETSLTHQWSRDPHEDNTSTFANDLADKTQYTSVSEENTKIGSVIHYRLDKTLINDFVKSAQDVVDKNSAEVAANPKLTGLTPDEAKKRLSDARTDGEDLVKRERHFSVVILKDQTGKKVKQIIQKAGQLPFARKVLPASDSRSMLPYTPIPVEGTKYPTYNKK